MNEFFICGDGWSGWLHEYADEQGYPYILYYVGMNEDDIRLFKRAEDVDQFTDELDAQFGNFPLRENSAGLQSALEREADGE